eukprot:1922633-Pleurochrysis_carterae.AAC.1
MGLLHELVGLLHERVGLPYTPVRVPYASAGKLYTIHASIAEHRYQVPITPSRVCICELVSR